MGIFFYECHYQMTDSLSFRNESYRLIFDLWVINHRQNYRFEMMPTLSLRNDGLPVTSRWLMMFSSKVWWLSLRYEDDVLFERWDWMPSAAFEMTIIFLIIEERCCVRSCLYSKRQFISKNDRTFLAMIVDFEWTINRQKLSKSYHLIKIGNLVKIFALISYLKENHMF